MEETIRRSKRARHAAEDPSFHYSPAVKKPKEAHGPCTLQSRGRMSVHALAKSGSAAFNLSMPAGRHPGKLAEAALMPTAKNASPAAEQPYEERHSTASPNLAFNWHDGTLAGLALDEEAEKAGSPRPLRDTSHDSSSSQVLLPKPDNGHLIHLQQRVKAAPSHAKGSSGRQITNTTSRKSRHKSKPVRSPFE